MTTQIPLSTFIEHLAPDPDYGYLLGNPLTLAAFQVSDYQVRKVRPNLTEGQHYIRLSNPGDNTPRIFYTFNGLLLLADLLGGDRAKAFKQELLNLMNAPQPQEASAQPNGAIVPAQASYMTGGPQRQYAEPEQPQWGGMVHSQAGQVSRQQLYHNPRYQSDYQPPQTAREMLRHEVQQAVSTSQNDTVEWLIQQQKLDLEKYRTYHNSFMDAQHQSFEQAGRMAAQAKGEQSAQTTIVQLTQRLHDPLAFGMFAAAIVTVFTIATILVVDHFTQNTTQPRPVSQLIQE